VLTPHRVEDAARVYPGVRLQGAAPGDDVAGLGHAGLDLLHDDPTGQLIDGAHRASLHRWWQAAKEEGVQAVATLKVGQGESAGELIDSLIALREEQDLLGVFCAARVWAAFGDGPAGSEANTAIDHLRAVAMARLVLDNILSLQAAPDTEGLGMAQASLRMGCDHFGWVSVDDPERVPQLVSDVEHHIRLAGLLPVLEGAGAVPVAIGDAQGLGASL
jgi:2-iminoacetate synthase ThiH